MWKCKEYEICAAKKKECWLIEFLFLELFQYVPDDKKNNFQKKKNSILPSRIFIIFFKPTEEHKCSLCGVYIINFGHFSNIKLTNSLKW